MARLLGLMGLAGSIPGLILVHVILWDRLHHAFFPQLLCHHPHRAESGEGGWRILLQNFFLNLSAVVPTDHCCHGNLAVHPDLE